jgi:uncharacterized protein YjbJ (UPF0337 family)
MVSNRVKGTVDSVVGVVKRKTGELTDNTTLQFEGAAQQVKGKLEKALGNAQDAVREANEEASAGSRPVV